ncbi:MAG: GNAT family N-acetyltransferase [Acidobacteria bacterium]|nr:GNAT family N-acetyltransferase [Acidobacteriota bacterium]
MKNITFDSSIPSQLEFCSLFRITGWYKEYNLTDEQIYGSATNSYFFTSVRDKGELIGCGRIISDGYIHALIVDMIIHPDYQGKGIGKAVLDKLISHCKSNGIIDIQLFCAKGKEGFYLKNSFVPRPVDAPGMQYTNKREGQN